MALVVWFGVVVSLAARGSFSAAPGRPPLPILLGVLAPLLAAALWWRSSAAFRALVAGADLRLLTAIQAWRFAGFVFLALLANRILPGVFAWPAGLGDMAIGMTAPYVMISIARNPRVVAGRGFTTWNVLGILDLVVAVSVGGGYAMFASGAPGEITTSQMTVLPLALIPAFFVPIFVALHVAALVQASRAREGRGRVR